jgi:ribosomal protein L40E
MNPVKARLARDDVTSDDAGADVTLQAPRTSADDARRWVCVACRATNPMEADTCVGCGVSFDDLLGGGRPAASVRNATPWAALREIGLLLGLFVLWKVAGTISLTQDQGAFDRARALWQLERTLRLPSEVALQAPILGRPGLSSALDVFYLAAHVGGMVAFLVWLFARHRESYRRWRNVVVAATAVCLMLQFVSVAPPRLLPELGFVDVGAARHLSAYQSAGPGFIDQLSSMPSIHVAWAIVIAVAVIAASRSPWRWLIVVHPLVTGYVVVVTANHFWLDGVAAAAVVSVILLGVQVLHRRRNAVACNLT